MKALIALTLGVFCGSVLAQTSPGSECSLMPPTFATNAPNIFNDRQEQDLGDALAEYIESDMRIAAPAVDDQITRIGEKLLAALPPTGVHYKFRVYDSGEINGFSLAGGRVYISRKLIAAVKNEDELAGVMAHEIGHLSTHQTAIEITRIFRIRLGVTQVGDRNDVFVKVHLMMSTQAKPKEDEGSGEKDELVADQVALYAMMRAGYAAGSFPSFFNQVSLNNGKTGNWLSDMFGLTHEATKRYRSAMKLIAALPDSCKGKQPGASPAFTAWLHSTVEERVKTAVAGISGDKPLTLDPPLRPSLWRVRFSPDGKLILAQDETGISIIDRDGAKVLFRIEAPDAEAAQFTPDSASVVFHDSKLRVEQWSVATRKRTSVHEVVVFDGCFHTLLTPDGKTLACAYGSLHEGSARVGVRLIDVESGKPYFEKPNFFEPGGYFQYSYAVLYAMQSGGSIGLVRMITSPDGKYLVMAAGDTALAFDVQQRVPVKLGGKLKDLSETRMSFIGSDQLYVVGAFKGGGMFQARVIKFPSGEVTKEVQIGDQSVESVASGQDLIIGPLKDYPVGVFDPLQGKVLAAFKFVAIDVWNSMVAFEEASGGVGYEPLGTTDTKHIPISLGPLPSLRAGLFSPDGKYLAVSMRNRAEMWSLETGKQVSMMRPFSSAWMDSSDKLYGHFPKYFNHDPEVLQINVSPFFSMKLAKLNDDDRQYHDLQISFKPLGKEKKFREHATLEVKQMATQTVAWSRDFPHETPACWGAEDDRLVLAWDLSNETARGEVRNYPALQAQADALKNKKKGLLLETVVPETGKALQQVIIPETDLTGGWNDVRHAMVSGEYVLANGEHGNTAIYKISDGTKIGEFFGFPVATDSASGLIAAVNREEEILLVDEHSGKELNRFSFGSPVLIARIVIGKDKTLLVLTADQVVNRMPLPQ
jgi:WD40 repeat protein